jgi:hypothetical protein
MALQPLQSWLLNAHQYITDTKLKILFGRKHSTRENKPQQILSFPIRNFLDCIFSLEA